MSLGKLLRLRRIFAQGRALIVSCCNRDEEPLARLHLAARGGADAVVVAPGLLERAAEEIGGLAVILRVDGGLGRTRERLVDVQAALEAGADAVAISLRIEEFAPDEALARFGRVAEDARRLGMPVLAETAGEDWPAVARLAADYGADIIQAPFARQFQDYRSFARFTGKRLVLAVGEGASLNADGLAAVYEAIQEAQGVVLPAEASLNPTLLQALHALLHQGVSAEEAAAIAWPRGT